MPDGNCEVQDTPNARHMPPKRCTSHLIAASLILCQELRTTRLSSGSQGVAFKIAEHLRETEMLLHDCTRLFAQSPARSHVRYQRHQEITKGVHIPWRVYPPAAILQHLFHAPDAGGNHR